MALLQKTVLSGYLKRLDKEKLDTLYHHFIDYYHNDEVQSNIKNLTEIQFQSEFLSRLFVAALGYTLNPSPNYNLSTEYKNQKDAKKADGAVIIGDKVPMVIELKGTDTTDLNQIENQAFGYKNNQPSCRYIVTSNFEKLRFYIDNAIEYIEFNLFKLTKADFYLLYLCLSFESIAADTPKQIKQESIAQESQISHQLYKDYATFKSALYADLTAKNPTIDPLVLFEKSQKLLDRFLFIFFAEDKGLLPPNFIRYIINNWKTITELDVDQSLYQRFKMNFNYLNQGHTNKDRTIFAYNGGLFAPDSILDALIIDDELLRQHSKKLSDYDFNSEVDVNILGHIFENSLTEIDEVKARLSGNPIDKSQSKRKKDGVFYTPKYITKYIVQNTLGKLCEDKKADLAITVTVTDANGNPTSIDNPEYTHKKGRRKTTEQALYATLMSYQQWLLSLTICDPACGSGAFLNETLNFLIKEHHYINELELKLTGTSLPLANIENAILENNIYGVDINAESVDIAKLALWLRTAKKNRKLNDLNDNLKCGNSLIDDPQIAGELAFDWEKEFPHVFANGGFDVVIGNPPYVKEYTAKSAFDGLRHKNCYQGKMDLWYFFGDLALDIVKKETGLIGYIAPNNWITNAGASNFRNIVLEKGKITDFIDFGDFKVFKSAGIQTMIYIMLSTVDNNNYHLNYSKILNKHIKDEEVINFLNKNKSNSFKYFASEINKKQSLGQLIHFIDKEVGKVIKTILEKQNFDFDKEEIAQGIVAPQDFLNDKSSRVLGETHVSGQGVFNLSNLEKDDYHFSPKELDLIKPFYTTEQLGKYYGNPNNNLWVIYTDSSFKNPNSLDTYPILKQHLDKFQKIITSSNKPYGLHRAREQKFFTGEKIISLRKCVEPTFTYTDFDCYVSQTYFSIKTNRLNMKFLTALLNSTLIKFWLKHKGKMQGDMFQVDKAPLMSLPIKTISCKKQFIKKTDEMLTLNADLQAISSRFMRLLAREFNIIKPNTKLQSWYKLDDKTFFIELEKDRRKAFRAATGSVKGFAKLNYDQQEKLADYFFDRQQKAQTLQTQINSTDKVIDNMVYELYGLNAEEIAIIEANT